MTYLEIEKAPTEDLPFEFNFGRGDFNTVLNSDPIDEASCTVKDWLDAPLSGVTVSLPTVVPTEPKVLQIRISGGTHATDYQIKLKAVTLNNDFDAECFILLRVRRPTVP